MLPAFRVHEPRRSRRVASSRCPTRARDSAQREGLRQCRRRPSRPVSLNFGHFAQQCVGHRKVRDHLSLSLSSSLLDAVTSPLCTVVLVFLRVLTLDRVSYLTSRFILFFGPTRSPITPSALLSALLGPRGWHHDMHRCKESTRGRAGQRKPSRDFALCHTTHAPTRLSCAPPPRGSLFLFFFFSFFLQISEPSLPLVLVAALKRRQFLLAGLGCRLLQYHADPAYSNARALPHFLVSYLLPATPSDPGKPGRARSMSRTASRCKFLVLRTVKI